jgi:hypothetical protein
VSQENSHNSFNPKKEEPLAEPFDELTYKTIQATAVLIEEPY